MAQPKWLDKYLTMKPEVSKIFDDLDKWLDHCRINLLPYNPKDLYRSDAYRAWQREQDYFARRAKKEARFKQGNQ